jgi:hypothetical protein
VEGWRVSYRRIRYDEPGGIDLRPAEHYRKKRRRPVNYIVLHWGGSSAFGLQRALSRRGLSTHYAIDGDIVYQLLPHEAQAWHAGNVNAWSVGIDFCQQPTVDGDRARRLKEKGWNVEEVDNPTGRGDRRIVTLNARAVAAARAFLPVLCEELGVPFRVPRGVDGLAPDGEFFHGVLPMSALTDGKFRGVVGHHHTRSTKWDIAPWWLQLFDASPSAMV